MPRTVRNPGYDLRGRYRANIENFLIASLSVGLLVLLPFPIPTSPLASPQLNFILTVENIPATSQPSFPLPLAPPSPKPTVPIPPARENFPQAMTIASTKLSTSSDETSLGTTGSVEGGVETSVLPVLLLKPIVLASNWEVRESK